MSTGGGRQGQTGLGGPSRRQRGVVVAGGDGLCGVTLLEIIVVIVVGVICFNILKLYIH